jgi:acyl-CoA thioesterase-1
MDLPSLGRSQMSGLPARARRRPRRKPASRPWCYKRAMFAARSRRARWLAAALLASVGACAVAGFWGRLERAPAHAGRPPNRWGGPLVAAPIVSRGKRVASRPPGASPVVDGVYRTGAFWAGGFPTPESPSWVAIRIGRGYSRLLLSWTSSGNHDYHDQFYGAPVDYRIETSSDSTNGEDGSWHPVVSVMGNPVRTRAHPFGFEGQRWVRLLVTRLADKVNRWGLFLDEIDVHDLSGGGNDVWVFLGDSITAGVFDRSTPHQPSFAAAIAARRRGYYPAMIEAGTGNLHAAEAADRVAEVLALNPEARVFAVGIGSNDNDPVAFRADLERLVRQIREAGRIPVLARIPFQTKYPSDYVGPLNQVIDEVALANGLPRGPDLYSWFKARPQRLSDGLHPDDRGSVEMNRLWALAAAPLYAP